MTDTTDRDAVVPWGGGRIAKGMHFRRMSDGFVFVVGSTSHKGACAFLQCVDASKIFESKWSSEIALSFERVIT